MIAPPPTGNPTSQSSAKEHALFTLDQLFVPVVIALLAVIVRAWIAFRTHSTTEDFYITLRYAENIAHGAGFVYNHGERILGTTTPLYTLLLALSSWLHLNPIVVGKALNIAADGVTCFLIAYLPGRPELAQPRVGQFAALLYAFSSTPISISIGGMETGIVTCVCMAMITAYVARSVRALYVLGAILLLLRIDGLVLFGLLTVCLALQQRRIPWKDMGIAALIITPWILFATVYFGSPIPTSLTAKLYVYSHAMATPRSVTIEAFRTQFMGGITQKALSLLFVIWVVGIVFDKLRAKINWKHLPHPGPLLTARSSPPASSATRRGGNPGEGEIRSITSGNREKTLDLRAALLAPIAWLCIYYLTMFVSRVPPFPWYFLPPWPIYLIVAMLGARMLVDLAAVKLPIRNSVIENRAVIAGLLAFGLYGAVHLQQIQTVIDADQFVEDTLREPIGLWFHENAKPNERILLEPIGYVGYFSQRPILDMIGLVSPEVFRSYQAPHPQTDMITRFHPDWLCIRPAEKESIMLGSESLLDTDYTYIREFHVEGRKPDFLIYHRKKGINN